MTPTGTPTVAVCSGDCHGDGAVTVDEILIMVNIALDNAPVSDCTAGDATHDGQITVDEIIAAVNNALNACPMPSKTEALRRQQRDRLRAALRGWLA